MIEQLIEIPYTLGQQELSLLRWYALAISRASHKARIKKVAGRWIASDTDKWTLDMYQEFERWWVDIEMRDLYCGPFPWLAPMKPSRSRSD